MGLGPTPANFALIAAVLACLPLLYLGTRSRPVPGGRPLVVLIAGAAVWGSAILVAETVVDYGASLLWRRFAYTGMALATLAWPLFALEATGHEDAVNDRVLGVLAVDPVLFLVLNWTNGYHGLVWAQPLSSSAAPTGVTIDAFGAFFWVHLVYAAAVFLGGAALLVRNAARPAIGRRTALAYAVAILAPVVAVLAVPAARALANAGGVPAAVAASVNPDRGAATLLPAGLAVSAVALAVVTFRDELRTVSPVAQDTIIDNISDGVIVLDEDDRVIDVNPAALRILGVAPEDEAVAGKHAKDLLSVYPGLYEEYADVENVQNEIGLKDGEHRRDFHIQVSPLRDARGQRMGRLFLIHDITDQKRHQRELSRQNQRLDQFASLVSHDLRNPLNVASGYVDLVEETGDMDHLEKIRASHERMEHLIEDVLTLAREGQTVTETEPVPVLEVAREAWENVDTKRATLELSQGLTIRADGDRFMRVFENLFRNAVEHGREDVTIGVGAIKRGDGTAGFYVADDGPGIPPDQRDEVLEDGFTTSDDGTGLGLSIVSSIVDAHGWSIEVTESTAGGARFEVLGVDTVDADDGGLAEAEAETDPGAEGESRPARADGAD